MMNGTALPRKTLSIIVLATLMGCGGGGDAPPAATSPPVTPPTTPPPPPVAGDPQITRTVVMSGLSSPWDLAFTSDNAMFFTERCRGLSVRLSNGTVQRLFGTTGSSLVATDLFCEGQSGVHGVAVDPSFLSNRFVYVYMASNLAGSGLVSSGAEECGRTALPGQPSGRASPIRVS